MRGEGGVECGEKEGRRVKGEKEVQNEIVICG